MLQQLKKINPEVHHSEFCIWFKLSIQESCVYKFQHSETSL